MPDIGFCRDCQLWREREIPFFGVSPGSWGHCRSLDKRTSDYKAFIFAHEIQGLATREDFGCVDFVRK